MSERPSLVTCPPLAWDGPLRVWVGINFKSIIVGLSFSECHSLVIGLGPLYFGAGPYGD